METLYMGEEQIVVKIGEKEKTYPAGVSVLSSTGISGSV